MVDMFGKRFKYIDTARGWFYWTKKRWAKDDSKGIARAAEMVARAIGIEAQIEGAKVDKLMKAAGKDEDAIAKVKDSKASAGRD